MKENRGMYDYSKIPAHMREGIMLYVERRVKPGSFLMAVLENDFVQIVGRADETNIRYLPQWAELLHWEIPSKCWGSPEKVKAWLGKGDK